MNVDFLKRKPIPKQTKGFDIFLQQPTTSNVKQSVNRT